MKRIELKDVEQVLYYQKLDNGLELYIIPDENTNNTYVTYTVKFGGEFLKFKDPKSKRMVTVPPGIAHFLEHKMFAQADGIDPMVYYAEVGADVNAFTSGRNTTYLFEGGTALTKNLTFLLEFVGNPYFTAENVMKEKGIIEQEIKMYHDQHECVIFDTLYNNLFHCHPLKHSILGTIKDINKITKEMLNTCYQAFYQPRNMFLVVTGKFEPKDIVKTVNNYFKELTLAPMVKLAKFKEPVTVVKKFVKLKGEITNSKLALGYKIPLKGLDYKLYKINAYLLIMFDLLFDVTSTFHEEMMEKGYLEEPLTIRLKFSDDYIVILLMGETKNYQALLNKINLVLTKPVIKEEDFKRKHKLLLVPQVKIFSNYKSLNHFIINYISNYGHFDYNVIKSLLASLNLEELNQLIKNINFKEKTMVLMEPLKEEGDTNARS